jgi:hypothetical protein
VSSHKWEDLLGAEPLRVSDDRAWLNVPGGALLIAARPRRLAYVDDVGAELIRQLSSGAVQGLAHDLAAALRVTPAEADASIGQMVASLHDAGLVKAGPLFVEAWAARGTLPPASRPVRTLNPPLPVLGDTRGLLAGPTSDSAVCVQEQLRFGHRLPTAEVDCNGLKLTLRCSEPFDPLLPDRVESSGGRPLRRREPQTTAHLHLLSTSASSDRWKLLSGEGRLIGQGRDHQGAWQALACELDLVEELGGQQPAPHSSANLRVLSCASGPMLIPGIDGDRLVRFSRRLGRAGISVDCGHRVLIRNATSQEGVPGNTLVRTGPDLWVRPAGIIVPHRLRKAIPIVAALVAFAAIDSDSAVVLDVLVRLVRTFVELPPLFVNPVDDDGAFATAIIDKLGPVRS